MKNKTGFPWKKREKRDCSAVDIKMNCVYNYCVQSVFFMRQFRFRQSTTNRYQSIPFYLSIGIDNRYQSITTRIFAIDWSSIININRLIDIDWYRLISIVIDYRFDRLDTPGIWHRFLGRRDTSALSARWREQHRNMWNDF